MKLYKKFLSTFLRVLSSTMSDSEDDSIASRVKNMSRLGEKQRENETPSAADIESDDDSCSIARRVKDMARLQKRRKKDTIVIELDDDNPVDEMSSDSEGRRPNLKRAKKEEGGGRRRVFDGSPTAQCEE